MAERPKKSNNNMFDMKNFKKGLIVVLENAPLEVAKVGTEYKLLNCDDHVGFLTKKGRDPATYRPDIAHQCLMTLLDSPLNKAGLLKVYVHTASNVLIDVNPKLRIPRTFKRFSGLIAQLLHTQSIKAEGVRGEAVLKLVKNPVTQYFPANTTVIGTSFSSELLVDIFDFVPKLFTDDNVKDEDNGEPAFKRIKKEEVEEEEVVGKSAPTKPSEDEEEVVEDEEGSGSGSDEEEEEEEAKEEEQVDEPPQDFSVKEEITFKTGKSVQDKIVVFVVGAMSHGKIQIDYAEKEISISQYPLSGSVACGKICASFEKFFGVI